jgi:hypothetical protein
MPVLALSRYYYRVCRVHRDVRMLMAGCDRANCRLAGSSHVGSARRRTDVQLAQLVSVRLLVLFPGYLLVHRQDGN